MLSFHMRFLSARALGVRLPRRTTVLSTRKLRCLTSSAAAASRPRPVFSAILGEGSAHLARRHVMTQSQPPSSAAGNIDSDNNTTSEAQNPITPESISKKLKERLGAIHADIVDMSGICPIPYQTNRYNLPRSLTRS